MLDVFSVFENSELLFVRKCFERESKSISVCPVNTSLMTTNFSWCPNETACDELNNHTLMLTVCVFSQVLGVCVVVLTGVSVCVCVCVCVCLCVRERERERDSACVSSPGRRLALPLSSINHGDCFLIPLP